MSNDQADLSLRHKTTYLTRCALCGATKQHFYSSVIGGQSFKFCSGAHLQRAKENYERNLNNPLPQQSREERVERSNEYEPPDVE